MVVEIDPDGVQNNTAKIRKGKLYVKNGIMMVSHDPKKDKPEQFPNLHKSPEQLE